MLKTTNRSLGIGIHFLSLERNKNTISGTDYILGWNQQSKLRCQNYDFCEIFEPTYNLFIAFQAECQNQILCVVLVAYNLWVRLPLVVCQSLWGGTRATFISSLFILYF